MRNAIVIVAAAVSCLAGVFANGSAKADVFHFSFGPGVSGTFTTDGAASDPGYDLITGLTFDLLSGTNDDGRNDFSFTNVAGENFKPGAAFNPTTDAFINHDGGRTLDDIGDFLTPGAGAISGMSFSQFSGLLEGNLFHGGRFIIEGPLEILRRETPPVPEASTWAMMLLGFGGLGLAAFRRRRRAVPAA